MNEIPKVVGGLYRVLDATVCFRVGGKTGDVCILIVDDNSDAPLFDSETWSGDCYINLCRLEFIGVMKYE